MGDSVFETGPDDQTVTGCDDCPLRQSDCDIAFKYYYECGHPQDDANGQDVPQSGPAPAWCPLRVRPLLLTLRP